MPHGQLIPLIFTLHQLTENTQTHFLRHEWLPIKSLRGQLVPIWWIKKFSGCVHSFSTNSIRVGLGPAEHLRKASSVTDGEQQQGGCPINKNADFSAWTQIFVLAKQTKQSLSLPGKVTAKKVCAFHQPVRPHVQERLLHLKDRAPMKTRPVRQLSSEIQMFNITQHTDPWEVLWTLFFPAL